MTYIEKLDLIFDLLLDENTYSEYGIDKQAKYWKMGTSFFTMLDRFLERINNLDISKPIISKFNPNNLTTEGNNKTYKFILDGENVTPCKVRGYVSNAAIHQYMRALCAFGLGFIEKNYENLNDFVISNGEIKLVHNIKTQIEKENRMFLIKKVIIDSFFSNIEHTRNIAYSIILEFLFSKKFDFSNLRNQIFYWNKIQGKRNWKKYKCASLVNQYDYIRKDIYNQGTKATYKEIIETLNNNYNSIEEFVKDIWNMYQEKIENNELFYDKKIQEQIEKINIKSKINSNRSHFKNNIFNDRKNKGLISSKNDLYSDIVDIDGNQDMLLSKFNESEAAHIYDVWKIKNALLKHVKSNDNNIYFEFIKDPNNGIIMKHDYHKSFDRGQWSFDSNGEMIVPYENQEYLFNVIRLKRIKINPKVLNDEMKRFLKMR